MGFCKVGVAETGKNRDSFGGISDNNEKSGIEVKIMSKSQKKC